MIISASRRTDIPAYYADWFINRIKDGKLQARNPINIHQISETTITDKIQLHLMHPAEGKYSVAYSQFLQGYTAHTIALNLTEAKIPTPGDCEHWNASTVRSILSAECETGI